MAKRNIYSASADEVRELFREYLSGPGACIVLALSGQPLDTAACNAIEKSLESFGYGTAACTYATLTPFSGDGNADSPDGVPLDAQALFLLVEGMDPLCVICADAAAVDRLGQAYRTPIEADGAARLLGRSVVAFRDLSGMLATERGKQRAWHLLKTLPRR